MAASWRTEARDGIAFAAAPSSLRLKVPRFDDGHVTASHFPPHGHFTCLLNLVTRRECFSHKGERAWAASTGTPVLQTVSTRLPMVLGREPYQRHYTRRCRRMQLGSRAQSGTHDAAADQSQRMHNMSETYIHRQLISCASALARDARHGVGHLGYNARVTGWLCSTTVAHTLFLHQPRAAV